MNSNFSSLRRRTLFYPLSSLAWLEGELEELELLGVGNSKLLLDDDELSPDELGFYVLLVRLLVFFN